MAWGCYSRVQLLLPLAGLTAALLSGQLWLLCLPLLALLPLLLTPVIL
jgi:hypothetical protein